MTTDRTTVNSPNILTGGFALLCRHWRCLTWAYFFNLLLAAVGTLPLIGQTSAMFNHSLYARGIAGRLDLGVVAEAGRLFSERPSGLIAGSVAMDMLFVAIFFLFTPAILSIYLGDELASAGNLFRIGFRFFWRMVRLAIVVAIIALVVLGILFAVRSGMLVRLDKTHVERAYFVWAAASFLFIMLVAFFIRLWFDLAQIVVVERGVYRIGRVEDRGVRHAFGPAWRLLRAGFWKLYLSCLLTAVLGRVALVLALLVWRASPPGATLIAFILAQIGAFLLLASRLWQRAVEVEWFNRHSALAVPAVAPLVAPVVMPPAVEPPPVLAPGPA